MYGEVYPIRQNAMNYDDKSEINCLEVDRLASSYDYELPPGRIAQNPAVPRDSARLLVVHSRDESQVSLGGMGKPTHSHHPFRDLPQLLRPGDLLVLNNTRVMPARLYGHKPGGAAVEVLLLEPQAEHRWLALVKPGKRLKPGAKIIFTSSLTSPPSPTPHTPHPVLTATILDIDLATGGRILQFELPQDVSLIEQLEHFGQVPFPPYITDSEAQPEQYQTVYATQWGAAAAPTAGLHFTTDLLSKLQARGIEQATITLHVGVGTFRPVEVETITSHQMHGEWIEVSQETVDRIHHTQARGGRAIAVGTTVARALEGAAQSGELRPYRGKTNLFIYPGYRWQVVEGLITNFHLPRSSLLMLVSALIGRQRLLELYQVAIDCQYRFYSFGDAMLILPEARCF